MSTFTSGVLRHNDPKPFFNTDMMLTRLDYATGIAMMRAGADVRYLPRDEHEQPEPLRVNPILLEYRQVAAAGGPSWALPMFLAAYTRERLGVAQYIIDLIHEQATPEQREKARRVIVLLSKLPQTSQAQPIRSWVDL